MPEHNTRGLELIGPAFYLGLISISLQVVLARLAVSFAGGNEVYLSLFFMFWLVITGIGAFLIKDIKPQLLFTLLGVFSVTMPSLYYLAAGIFDFLPGQLVPPEVFILTTIIVLLPICLINGGLFSSISRRLGGEARSGRTYWNEAFGALAGGAGTTVYYYAGGRDYSMLFGIALLCIVLVPVKSKAIKLAGVIAFGAVIALAPGNFIENRLLAYHYKPLQYNGSVSGRLVRYDAISAGDIISLFSGGAKAADFPDYQTSAELFYWPFLANPGMKSIAFIGGEMYDFKSMVPDSIQAFFIYAESGWRKLMGSEFPGGGKRDFVNDPVAFMKDDQEKFGAIIINAAELLSLYNKRLETEYFLDLCRSHLNDNGVLCFNVESYRGLWRDDLKIRLYDLYRTLNGLFDKVYVIPGDRMIFLAGRTLEFGQDIALDRLADLGIDSPYMNEAIIRARLNPFNLSQTMANLEAESYRPEQIEIDYGLSYYFSQLGIGYNPANLYRPAVMFAVILGMILLSLLSSRFQKRQSIFLINILFFGSTSFALELLAMYKIQLFGGYLYLALGIVIGLFMLGMALGAFYGIYLIKSVNLPKNYKMSLFLAIGLIMSLAVILLMTRESALILLIVIGLAGAAGGLGFSACSRLFDSRPGLPYGFDLLGGVMGTLIGLGILAGGLPIEYILAAILMSGIILLATNGVLLKY